MKKTNKTAKKAIKKIAKSYAKSKRTNKVTFKTFSIKDMILLVGMIDNYWRYNEAIM